MESKWKIRPAKKEDIPFIYSTWTKSYKYGSVLGKSCSGDVFFPEYNRVIDWILSQPNVSIEISCDPDQIDVIFGYAVFQHEVLHYVFVKEAFWNLGIGKSLLNRSNIQFFTHKTTYVKPILLLSNYSKWIYNPFLLYYQGESLYGIKV